VDLSHGLADFWIAVFDAFMGFGCSIAAASMRTIT
jgi:hypothetical protein